MKKNLLKFVSGLLTGYLILTSNAMAGFDVKDTMSSSVIANDARHRIEMNIISSEVITNGSIKIDFDDSFNFTGMLSSDVTVSGGDVIWSPPVLDLLSDIIVLPFTGNIDNTDGIIQVNIGSVNYIDNPIIEGSYGIIITSHQSADGSGNFVEYKDMRVAITKSVMISATVPQTLTFIVSGVGMGQIVNGAVTNVATNAVNVNFGTLLGAGQRIGAQDLSVSTNATDGYTVTIEYNNPLKSGIYTISDWTGTNSSPTTWVAPTGSPNGYFGYTTNDNNLRNVIINRFIPNKWAGNWSSPKEVMYHDGPADGVSPNSGKVRVGFRLGVTDWQESGTYTSIVTYVCTPSF